LFHERYSLLILYLLEDEPQTLSHLLPDERWFDNRESLENCQENATAFRKSKGPGPGAGPWQKIHSGLDNPSCFWHNAPCM